MTPATMWIGPLCGLLLAPLLPGVINRVKAVFAGRHGQPILQGYHDLFKLVRKGVVYSETSGGVFRFAPYLTLSAVILALFLMPMSGIRAPLSFQGDFLLLVYLLGIARFAMVLAALDTGSSFEGMGASREVQFSALAEPCLLVGLLFLSAHSGRVGLSDILSRITAGSWQDMPAMLALLGSAWFILLLAENARIPVDDPNTHLELTMIHEVMILDTSGPDFGAMLYAAALKLWIFGALLLNLILPLGPPSPWIQILFFMIGMLVIAAIVGVVESIMARLRLLMVPKLLIGATALVTTALIMKMAMR